jgi:hypothetical protein
MPETALSAWESFYVIVGSSAAALTGLQFVVVVLSAEMEIGAPSTTRAFGTPTIVHFCAVLLLSAILSAPWRELANVALLLGLCGASGIAYALMVVRHMRWQTEYKAVLEDWIWFGALPLLTYAVLLVAAVLLIRHPLESLFAIGASAVLLLFIGIHNAWDAVTYIAHQRRNP